MINNIQPATLASASIVIQVCLFFIAYVALWLLSKSYSARKQANESHGSLVVWILLTLVLILMGEDIYIIWSPILGHVSTMLPTVARNYSFLAVFVIDIVFVTNLVLRTGGTKRSPFTSVLFLLPSLAIFLREPVGRFLFYSAIVGIVYVALLRTAITTASADFDRSDFDGPSKIDDAVDDRATMWTNVSCLALATLIGFITQPDN